VPLLVRRDTQELSERLAERTRGLASGNQKATPLLDDGSTAGEKNGWKALGVSRIGIPSNCSDSRT
jgi:hypothetical protein